MKRTFAGGVLLIAGIAAFIEAARHAPSYFTCAGSVSDCQAQAELEALREITPVPKLQPGHLDPTAYDLLHIGGWALAIFGALLIIVGLIGLLTMSRVEQAA